MNTCDTPILCEDMLADGPVEAHQFCGQSHVHAYTSVTDVALGHSHLIIGVSGDALPLSGGSHYHQITGRTDWRETHYHGYCIKTGPAIQVNNTVHIHYYEGTTIMVAGHLHSMKGTTLATELPIQ
jgi:hypothetical protein